MDNKKIDINTASLEDFEKLIGIGHAKAEAIIEARKTRNGFTSVNELMKIPGIGPGILDPNRSNLTCSLTRKKKCPARKTEREIRKLRKSEHRTPAAVKLRSSSSSSSGSNCVDDEDSLLSLPGLTPPNNVMRPSVLLPSGVGEAASLVAGPTPHASPKESKNDSTEKHETSDEADESDIKSPSRDTVVKDEKNSDNFLGEGTSNNDKMPKSCVLKHEQSKEGVCESSVFSDSSETEDEHVRRRTDNENDSPDEDCDIEYRSKFSLNASTPDKHFMKRKSASSPDANSVSPGKKQCKPGSHDSEREDTGCPFSDTSDGHSHQSRYRSLVLGRRKIPSKSNPPPELAQWLKTYQMWTNAEKLLALDELIEVCEPTQVRHVMSIIEPQFQRDFISLLPKELALYVLAFLEPRDLCRAAQTCRYWRVLTEDNLLWREKCKKEKITRQLVFGDDSSTRNSGTSVPSVGRSMRSRSSSGPSVVHSISNVPSSPCKAMFRRQHIIEQNWRHGEIKAPKVLRGHDDHVITCLEFSGNLIVSGSDDNTLKVWSAITGKCLRTLTGHTGGVWSSQMAGHIIISGSTDRTLRVWNADTGSCIHTLYGHTSTVRCMHLEKNKVVSGSRDATLRVWDVDSGACLHVLMGHVAAVRCVQYDGRRVVSGAYDFMVKVWDPETETCIHTLQGHTNRVYSLQFDGKHIVSGSLDTSIRVWDVDTGNCLHTLIGHQSLTSGMELKDNILVSGNADSTVKVWDITTGQCLQTLQGANKHQSAVTCLQFNRKFVITSSDDGTVKVWDLKTGDFLRNLVALESGGSGGVVWRIKCTNTKLVCAVGSRNGTEETKLQVLDFDVDEPVPT